MNKLEVGKMLTVASGLADFIVADEVTVTAWQWLLADVALEDAMNAMQAHFTGPQAREKFSVAHVLDFVKSSGRQSVAAIEADVRSAKNRGLVEKSWPNGLPLTPLVQARLASIRLAELAEIPEYSRLSAEVPAWVGTVGKATP
jgi:hypothetical protein